MRWQFGGNIRPVRLVCELNWKECPYAILNYMWSEIVTDVVDCVTNESILLRIIILLLVSTILVHTIWSRLKSLNESVLTKETLNEVGYKLQDLELRVNILTYKMQYGTWPLPEQIKGTTIEGHKQNIRLTLSDNQWFNKCLKAPTNDHYNSNSRVRKPKDKKFNYRSDKSRRKDKNLINQLQNCEFISDLKPENESYSSTSHNSLEKFDGIYSESILQSSQKQISTKESLADVQLRLEKLQTVLKSYSEDNLLVIESSDGNKREEFKEFLKELSDLKSDSESDFSKKSGTESESKEIDKDLVYDVEELKQSNQFYLEKPKVLEIINEETGSSCTEKISKSIVDCKKISEESEISLDSVESSKEISRNESLEKIQELNALIKLENKNDLNIENKFENKNCLEEKISEAEDKNNEEDLINLNDEVEVEVEVKLNNKRIDCFRKLNLMDEDKLDDLNLSDEPLTARTVNGTQKNLIELEQIKFEALELIENSWGFGITKTISETSMINLDLEEELKLSDKSVNVLSKESSIYLTVDSGSDLSEDKSQEKMNLLENLKPEDQRINICNESTGLSCDCSLNLSDSKSSSNLSETKFGSNCKVEKIEKDNDEILIKNCSRNKGVTRSNSNLTRDNGERIINLQRRSKSYVTPRKVEASPRISGTSFVGYNSRSRESINKLSKSCIPVLKTRERKDEYRPKSPARGPLTVSVSLENSRQNIPVITEGTFCEPVIKRNCENKNTNEFIMKDQTIIYVNVVADNDNCVTKVIDPKTFLEFIKDRELSVQEVTDNNIQSKKNKDINDDNKDKIITVVSSVSNNNKNNNYFNNSYNNKVKEKQVLAKPSITHTSTSISDLSAVSKLKFPNNDHKHFYNRSNSSVDNIFKRKKKCY